MSAGADRASLLERLPLQGGHWGPDSMELSGLARVRALLEGSLPEPPCVKLSGLRPTEVGPGMCTFAMPPSPWWQSAANLFPGGVLVFAADSSLAAVLTSAEPGVAASTSELSISFLRPATTRSGAIIVRSRLVYPGRSMGLATFSVEDGRGRTLAHGTSSGVLFPVPSALATDSKEEPVGTDPAPHELPVEGEVLGQEFFNVTPGIEALPKVMDNQPITRFLGLKLDGFDEGSATLRMPASDWLTNQGGVIYGGFIAVLADLAQSATILSLVPAATSYGPIGMRISFLRPTSPHEGDLVASVTTAHRGRAIVIVQCEITNGAGKLVAMASESFLVLPGRPWDRSLNVAEEIGATIDV